VAYARERERVLRICDAAGEAEPCGWSCSRRSAGWSASTRTVQDYLKSIFTKTSVRSRGALLSRALGT